MEDFLRYTIQRKIDSGGMATVYLALDETLRRDVALKMIHPHLAERPEALKRFENEARAIAALSHENVIKLFDFGRYEGKQYLVMEFIDGCTLQRLLELHAVLPNLVLLEMMSQIFAGLAAAHEKGVYHRDVKPSNIMIDKYGTVKIMDFGIAHMASSESLTMTGTFVGSPHFISPEQGQGRKVCDRSDVFAAGAVFYQCASGSVPFDGENPHAVVYAIVNHSVTPANDVNPRLLPQVSGLIGRCLAKEPAQRPSAANCCEDIARISADLGLSLGRRRIARFVEDPKAYTDEEDREMLGFLRQAARDSYVKGRFVVSLRQFMQAEQFGNLSSDDRRLMSAMGRGMRLRRVAQGITIGGSAAGILALAVLMIAGLARRSHHSDDVRPVPAVRIEAPPPVPAPTVAQPMPAPVRAEPEARPPAVRSRAESAPGSSQASAAPAPVSKGFLCVKTRPPYADVIVDGIPAGSTPLDECIPLDASAHRLILRKDNFAPADTAFVVKGGDTLTMEIMLRRSESSP